MGNESTKHAASTLSQKEIAKLRTKIIREYPWLEKVEESMLITDCRKPDCPIVFANNDFHGMTQYTKEEVLGFNCRFLQGRHTNPKTVDKVREAIANGTELEVEILNYRKDGTPFLNNFVLVPLHTKGGKTVTHFLAVQKDVTYLLEESDPSKWRPAQIALWLERAGYEEYAMPFIENEVNGMEFLELTIPKLKKLGIVDPSIQQRLFRLIQMLATHGPGFVFAIEQNTTNPTNLLSVISEKTASDHFMDDSEDEDDNSNSELELSEDSQDDQAEQDLVQPEKTAFLRRKKHLKEDTPSADTPELSVEDLSKASSQVVLHCSLYNLEKDIQGPPQDVFVQYSDLLYHVKLAIKTKLDIDAAIDLKIKVNDTWKKVDSQATYKEILEQETVEANEVDVLVVETCQEMFANMFGLDTFKENIKGNDSTLSDLVREIHQDQHEIEYLFLLDHAHWGNRAMMFDTMFCNAESNVKMLSLPSIWQPLENLATETGTCFVIPCTSTGALLSEDFPYKEDCQRVLQSLVERSMGEIPLGTTVIRRQGKNMIMLLVMTPCSLTKDKSGHNTYYISFRSALVTINEHNQLVKAGSKVRLLELVENGNNQNEDALAISRMYFPVYTIPKGRKVPETMKLGHQLSVAFASFDRWQYCVKKKKDLLRSYHEQAPLYEKKLRHGAKRQLSRKEETFLQYISSGTLANRGLMDDQEIEWLVETCGFEAPKRTKFSHSRRLQRLAVVSLSALINNKRFDSGEEFQKKLRSAVVRNVHSLQWLLKLASAGSLTVCPLTTMDQMGKLIRFARGNSCSLYKTTWNEKEVAVKLFNDDKDNSSILQEISVMSLLQHPHILPVYAWGTSMYENARHIFSVSPYASKGSLFNILRNKPELLDEKARFEVILQVAQGLSYLHSLQIIHRDLKSLNVLLCEDDRVYVTDIGSSRIQAQTMTVNVGTPIWMAPEVFARHNYTFAVDVYSLSIILYELLTDEIPFEKSSSYEIPSLVTKGVRPVFGENISKPWVKLVQSMWHEKPNRRPSITEVITIMESLRNTPFKG